MTTRHQSNPSTNRPQRMFTLTGGGWVLVVSGILCLAILIWAVLPAVLQVFERPPGDGRNVDTYGFDLSALTISRETFVPAMLHRDMPPRWLAPGTLTVEQLQQQTEEERGKYLVPTDRVIGVTINGEARAYPISVLTVHEIINDVLGGVPITVTYSWLGDVVRVFDSRVGEETFEFGVSGLIHNANLLMYDRRPPPGGEHVSWEERGESLWSQLLARAVSGPAAEAGLALTTISAQLVSWRHWTELHPDTTVIVRDPMLIKRYNRATPRQYFRSPDIPYPVDPLPGHGPEWKEQVIVLIAPDGRRRVYPVKTIAKRAEPRAGLDARYRAWNVTLSDGKASFIHEPASDTVAVESDDPIDWVHCFWFAWHSMHPADELAE